VSETQQELLDRARALVTALEAGDQNEADCLMAEITTLRESNLFRELGKLTREFHEALNNFRFDEKLSVWAEEEIPDAKDRLNHVITMTDSAAHRTLEAVEHSLPVCEELMDKTNALNDAWRRFTSREMSAGEFRQLSGEIKDHFSESRDRIGVIKADLNSVLMAQDFQDLTGQIIRRVIRLVDDMEKSLVELVRIAGTGDRTTGQPNRESEEELAGPQVPGLESETALSGQDDVDELLSSLGF